MLMYTLTSPFRILYNVRIQIVCHTETHWTNEKENELLYILLQMKQINLTSKLYNMTRIKKPNGMSFIKHIKLLG